MRDGKEEMFCSACKLGKLQRLPAKAVPKESVPPGEIVHFDLAWPFKKSLGGATMFILMKDQGSEVKLPGSEAVKKQGRCTRGYHFFHKYARASHWK